MASRKVYLKLYMPCLINNSNQTRKSYKEWFKGDLDDIKGCVEYWAEVVRVSYVDREFIGNVSEISEGRLSSRGPTLESAEESARLRDKLNASPCRRPQGADVAGRLDAGTHAAREEKEVVEEEDGCGEGRREGNDEPEEVRSRRGGVI